MSTSKRSPPREKRNMSQKTRLSRLEQRYQEQKSEVKLWVAGIDDGIIRAGWVDLNDFCKWHPDEDGKYHQAIQVLERSNDVIYETQIGSSCALLDCPFHAKDNRALDARGMLHSIKAMSQLSMDELVETLYEGLN